MSLLALYGTGYNQLTRMVTAATPEAADSLYPIANLYDGQPWKPFRFGAAGTSGYIDFDLNQVVNGEFGTAFSGGLPGTGWGKSSGATLTLSAGKMQVAGGDAEYAYYDLSVAAGEVLTFTSYLEGVGLGGGATIHIRNLSTGNYLSSGGTWTSAVSAWDTRLFSSNTKTSVVTIESYSTVLSDRCTIRFSFFGSTAGSSPLYDDFLVYPRINFGSIHGHNIQPNTAPVEIRSGTTSPAATTRATMTLAHPTMFSTFSSVDARYWRLFFTSDPLSSPTWLGEVVLGQYQTLTRRQNYGQDLNLIHAQDRDSTDLGPFTAYLRQEVGRRKANLSFRYNTDADYEQAREIVERSKGGANPLVLVLETADETTAILGRISQEWAHSRVTKLIRDASWEIEELPFPVVLP